MLRLFFCLITLLTASQVQAQLLAPSQPLRFLALGDSYTIGQSVPVAERWPVQLRDSLAARGILQDSLHIIATTGWRTDQLLNAIEAENLQPDWNLVSVLIGVNNQYQNRPLQQYYDEFPHTLDSAIALAGGNADRVFVVSIPDYAFTPFGQNNNPTIITQQLETYNAINDSITAAYGLKYFNITPLSQEGVNNPSLVASDGLHPSGSQYTQWVELILETIDAELNLLSTSVPAPALELTLSQNRVSLIVDGLPDHRACQLHVYDLKGKWLLEQEHRGTSSVVLSTVDLPAGTYVLQVQDPKGRTLASEKFVKVK